MNQLEENSLFNLATQILQFTNSNLFLTGKAGTGKTTFLKHIKQHQSKNMVVVAPTGVAAINAGGVTMHSFFQLPFIPYLPDEQKIFGNNATVDKYGLIKNIRFSKDKIELLNDLELLIIDEVSMLRADMLDAIDEILKHFRNQKNKPFGGIQVLFIGDLFQLPPVVNDAEWNLMKEHYESPFFFNAKVIEQHPLLFIELKKVYRQNEELFIQLLNNIRNNTLNDDDIQLLKTRYQAKQIKQEGITLTTHNYMADTINREELNKLQGKKHLFTGEIKGDFSDKALPTEKQLELKIGAQVMFIKNDNEEKKYYNGSLAKIIKLSDENISVELNDNKQTIELEKEKWSSIKYTLNKETNKIEEEELGSFLQYPIRLAWAITIHKSQGLTFDYANIDAGASFAAGQVYVALSRCRTLDGITLLSPITSNNILNDHRIVKFTSQENSIESIADFLQTEKPKFASQLLLKTFDWQKIITALKYFDEQTSEKKLPEKDTLKGVSLGLLIRAETQQQFAKKFISQLENILNQQPINTELLNERVTKAKQYFANALHQEIIRPLNEIQTLLKGKSKVKQYHVLVNELEATIWKKLNAVQRITFGELSFDIDIIEKKQKEEKIITRDKAAKGQSKVDTLNLHREGKTIPEIATLRGLAISTIESHLSSFVETGELNIYTFLSKDELQEIANAYYISEEDTLTPLKDKLKDKYSFVQLRMAVSHINKNK